MEFNYPDGLEAATTKEAFSGERHHLLIIAVILVVPPDRLVAWNLGKRGPVDLGSVFSLALICRCPPRL